MLNAFPRSELLNRNLILTVSNRAEETDGILKSQLINACLLFYTYAYRQRLGKILLSLFFMQSPNSST